MPKPLGKSKLLSLETSYQKLKYRLSTCRSTRIKLEHLRLFLDPLARKDDSHEYFSYFEELIQNYTKLLTQNNLECRSIDVLMSLRLIEDTFVSLDIKEIRLADFLNTQKILSNQIVLTYIYLGEWYQGLRVLSPNLKQSDFIKVYSNIKDNLIKTLESSTLNKLVDSLGDNTLKKNKNIKTLLSSLEAWEEKLAKPEIGKVWVLLVEYESQDVFGNNKKDENIVAIGNIQQMDTSSHSSTSNSAYDLVLFNNLSISYNDLLYQQANTAIKVARDQLGKSVTKANNKYNVIYSFAKKEPYYSGESLGLAMTLSALSSISQNNDYKNKYSLLQDYCATGSVAHDGTVNPISYQALATKINMVFYSPFKKVLIPKGNKASAIKELKKLKEHYPNRELELIAIANVKDAVTSDRITLKHKTSLTDQVLHYWRYWKIATIILLLGLVIANVIVQFTSDKNPVELRIAGSRIEVNNINHAKLWEYDFKYNLDIAYYNQTDQNVSLYVFDDLNNDGKNELIFGKQCTEKGEKGCLFVFDSKGQILWEYNKHPKMTFGEKSYNDIYSINNIKIHEFDGTKIIFVSFCQYIWYPSRLVAFNVNGDFLGDYWNSGVSIIKNFIDIDEDGVDEIFLGGCNNEYNNGIIAVLEHDRIDGHSPQLREAYIPKNIPKGTEKYYIKFPYPAELLTNSITGSIIQVEIIDDEIVLREKMDYYDSQCAFYTLNKKFEIINFAMNNSYIVNYNSRTGRDFLTDYPQSKLKEMFYKLEFWDGNKFVQYPAMSNPS